VKAEVSPDVDDVAALDDQQKSDRDAARPLVPLDAEEFAPREIRC